MQPCIENGINSGRRYLHMSYLVATSLIIITSLLLGYALSDRVHRWHTRHGHRGSAAILGAVVAWVLISYGLHRYAEGDAPGWAFAEWFAHGGKWFVFASGSLFLLGATIRTAGGDRRKVFSSLAAQTLIMVLLVWRTIPTCVWLSAESRRDALGNMRQRSEYTCGPVCLGNLIETDPGCRAPSERELARLCGTTVEGTTLSGLIAAAKHLGLMLVACKVMDVSELESHGGPAIVQISTIPQVRHATLLLKLGPESATFIDPSYGYRTIPRKRFQEIWYGKTTVFR